MRSSAISFKYNRLLFPLKPSSSCLDLLPCLRVSSFPSITKFRRQFLHKLCPIQLAFLALFYVKYSFPPWLNVIFLNFHTIRLIHLLHPSPTPHVKNFNLSLLRIYFRKCPNSRITQNSVPKVAFHSLLASVTERNIYFCLKKNIPVDINPLNTKCRLLYLKT